jgi:N-acylglucosamine-6-phosphate 2-epimerase
VHSDIVSALVEKILTAIEGRLIVSCQASKGDPLDDLDTLRRLATSVLLGGAAGLRAEGCQSIAAFRELTSLPIIGLVKTWDSSGDVYITPSFAAAKSVSDAGADVIALDCTRRRLSEPEPWTTLIPRIHAELGKVVCADVAALEDALLAQEAGADIVATTLRGYTPDTRDVRSTDWLFLEQLIAALEVPVILEGQVTAPDEVRRALSLGVHAVVVGSAITRPQTITERFVAATVDGRSGRRDRRHSE